MGEQLRAGLGELVQHQGPAGERGEDGEQPSAGGGLQHQVTRRDRSGGAGREAERDRRRELLERHTLLGAARMRRRQRGQPRQHSEHPRRAAGAGAHGPPVPAQEQNLRRLAGLVGVLPYPGARRVGCAERRLHGGAQDGGIEGLAPLQRGQQQTGGVKDGGRPIGRSGRGCEHGRPLGQRWDDDCHGGIPESGVPKPAGALSTPPGSPGPGPPLALRAPRALPVTRSGALVPARVTLHMTN
jgi:hypothetical protein